MTQKKAAPKKASKQAKGNQTSTDKPVEGGLGGTPVTAVPEDQKDQTGANSPYAS